MHGRLPIIFYASGTTRHLTSKCITSLFFLFLLGGTGSVFAATCVFSGSSTTISSDCSGGALSADMSGAITINSGVTHDLTSADFITTNDLGAYINNGTVDGGTNGFAFTNYETIGAFTNNGTVTFNGSSGFINEYKNGSQPGVITTFTNNGTWNSGGSNAFFNQADSTIGTWTNTGTFNCTAAAYCFRNSGSITTLNNSGTMNTDEPGGYGFYNQSGVIGTINNSGTWVAPSSNWTFGYGTITTMTNTGTFTGQLRIRSAGTLATLNNDQGASGNNALDYAEKLPTNYNIIVNSASDFGKVVFSSVSGTTNFGVHSSSTLATGTTYSAVIVGLSAGEIASGTSGTFNGASWTLNNSSGTTWDLVVSADTTAPTLSSSSPTDNATSVAVGSNIVLTFSEAVDVESGNITIKKTSDDSTIATIDVTGGLVTGTGSTAITVNPSSDLSESTEYYVLIGATAFDDPSGNSYAGISSTTALSFTTIDSTAPTISSTTVASDNATIAVTFSEAVYTTTGGSGALVVGDFTVSISGGAATLSSATPSSISSSGNVYTLGLNLSGTANGSETITVAPSSSTAIYDGSDNAVSTTPSNNTVALNSGDSTAPTLTSSSPASGATGIALNANVVLTFSEAMSIGTGNVTLTGNGSTETIAVGSAQVTGAGTSTITINPANDFVAGVNYSIVIPATAFDDAAGNSYAGTTITFLSFLPTPTNNQEVVKTIESQASIAASAIINTITPVTNRIRWLRQHKGDTNLSRQGIKISFGNEWVDRLVNARSSSTANDINGMQLLGMADKYIANPDYIKNDLQMALTDSALNQFAELKEEALQNLFWHTGGAGGVITKKGELNLNPTGSIDEDWAIWTAGDITFGEVDATSSRAQQESESKGITVGLDRYIGDNALIGFSVRGGEDNTDVGSNGTRIEGEGYHLSVYGVLSDVDLLPGLENMIIESAFGGGHINMDMARRDDNGTALTGVRRVNQIFGSLTFRGDMDYAGVNLYPYGKIDASYTDLNAYQESGSNFALGYASQSVEHVIFYAGLDLDYAMDLWSGVFMPYGRFEYGADVSSQSDASLHYVVTPGTNYSLVLNSRTRSNLKMGIGFNYRIDTLDLSAGYEHIESFDVGHSDSLNLNAGMRF